MLHLFPMWPTLFFLKNGTDCDLSLNTYTWHTIITSRRDIVCFITYLSVGTMLKMFSIMPADHSGLYLIIPSWRGEYECPYLLLMPSPLAFSYYGAPVLHGSSDDTRRVASLAIYEFAVLDSVLFLLYSVRGAVPN